MQPFLKPLNPALEKEYLLKSQQGDKNARSALIAHNMRLVAHIVKKYSSSGMEQEDMMSQGTIGLLKAIDTYDIKKGSRLVTYASRCIENEILMQLRQEKKTLRENSLFEPLGKDKDGNEMSLIDVLETDSEDIIEDLHKRQQIDNMKTCIGQCLTPKERQILMLRYGLAGNCLTQKEVGEQFGISRSYVSRIEKRALLKLRRQLS